MTIVLSDPQDTYNAAQILLDLHGGKAEKLALDIMLEMVRKNDIASASLWLSIANVIEELRMFKAKGTLH